MPNRKKTTKPTKYKVLFSYNVQNYADLHTFAHVFTAVAVAVVAAVQVAAESQLQSAAPSAVSGDLQVRVC